MSLTDRRFLVLAMLFLAGCSSQSSSPPAAPEVAAAVSQQETTPRASEAPVANPAAPPKKAEPPAPPPEFPFPADAAGKLLPKVVVPPAPPPPTEERPGIAPLMRTPPSRVIDPVPVAKTIYAPPPLLPAKSAGLKPRLTAPPERVPPDLGFGAVAAVPAKPALPMSPGITQKARDVSIPPDLAPLGRQVLDRASLDDPTAEPANAAIVGWSPTPTLAVSGFLRVMLPDPFELGEQVKPKVPPAAEPGLAPVVVNPQRLK